MTAPDGDGQDTGQDTGEDTGERLDRVESAITRIEGMLSRLVPTGSRADSQQRVERHLDRGSSIEEQVRAELDRRDKAAADQAAQKEAADSARQVQERIAALEERPPAPPVKRATKALGWGAPR